MRMNDGVDPLRDTQGAADTRAIAIQRVGVKALKHPLTVEVDGRPQPAVGLWTLDVALPAERKGTHMSRFVAWLQAQAAQPLTAPRLAQAFEAMLALLDASEGRIEVHFDFFLNKRAPVSGVESLLDYRGAWVAERHAGQTRITAEVAVPVKSLCPCSKEISAFGAHNQRSLVTIRAAQQPKDPVSWSELVRFAEGAASSEIWAMLKRADEKWVTEQAYNNPKFVEDLVRDVALALNADARIGAYAVEVENFESIHNHSAFACVTRGELP